MFFGEVTTLDERFTDFSALKDKEVTKIATHTEGKHFMALTKDFDVFSWGNGDGGRLGKFFRTH